MRVTIHQPDFVPWYGYFERWAVADLFIILDDVQFLRRGWHHRDKIKTRDGPRWLTLPTIKSGRYNQLIRDVELSHTTDWVDKHLTLLRHAYRTAPGFTDHFDSIIEIYNRKKWVKLLELNLAFLELGRDFFGVRTPTVLSSTLGISSRSTARLVELVQAVGGTEYISGMGAKAYLDESKFKEAGLGLIWEKGREQIYPQLHDDFIPRLSFLDMMFMNVRGQISE